MKAVIADKVLAIDVGTQSVRALAFDALGNLIAGVQLHYDQPYESAKPGFAEQDADYFWRYIADACQQLWKTGDVLAHEIAGVAVTTQRATIVPLDEHGVPLRKAMLWLDQRKAELVPTVGATMEALLFFTRLRKSVRALQASAQANWLLLHEPDLWAKIKKYIFLSGYVTYKLTGEFKDSTACQVGYIPFDYQAQTWPRASHWMWRAIPVKREWLPTLVQPGGILGYVTVEAAACTGLVVGLPVIAAASDKACETLGAGCLDESQGCIGYGTTATINVNVARYKEPVFLQPAYPSAAAGQYQMEIQIFRGFWLVSWFKDEFAKEEQRMAKERGIPVEVWLDREIADVKAGADGLLLQPFWSAGVRYPGLEARGAVIGFHAGHTKAHLYKALLEGLAYSMREGKERIERKTGTLLTKMFICGGGSQSDQMMQITADVLGMPVVRTKIHEASGLGAAILATVGVGWHADLHVAVRAMTGQGESFEPRKQQVQVYDQVYRHQYRRMYSRLRPLYRAMSGLQKKES